MTTKVFYHRDADGIASAYAYWVGNLGKVAIGQDDPNVEYQSINYGDAIDTGPHSKLVFLDFTPPLDLLLAWSQGTRIMEVEVTDHHATAESIWSDFNDSRHGLNWLQEGFDSTAKGACSIAWKRYAAGNTPWQLMHIGARDVWDFSNPYTKGICKFLSVAMPSLDDPKACFAYLTNTRDIAGYAQAEEMGRLLIQNDEEYIRNTVKNATPLTIIRSGSAGTNTLHSLVGVNANFLISEVAAELNRTNPLVCVYNVTPQGLQMSFRSIKDAPMSAATAAKRIGGGGHSEAAGARVIDYEIAQTSMGVTIRVR